MISDMVASRSNTYIPNPHLTAKIVELETLFPTVSCLLKVLAFFDHEEIQAWIITYGATWLADLANRTETVSVPSSQQSKGKSKIANGVRGSLAIKLWPTTISGLVLDRTKFPDALQILENNGLLELRPSPQGTTLRFCNEVQSLVQERVRQKSLDVYCRRFAATMVCGAFSRPEDVESASSWPFCEQILPHARSLAAWNDSRKGLGVDLLRACRTGAQSLLSRGYFEEAGELIMEVLSLQEDYFGFDDTEVLRCSFQLARIRSEQGLFDEAERIYRQVYATREEILGPTYRYTLNILRGVADVCRKKEKYDEAEEMYRRALAGIEETRGYSDSLIAMNDLALTYALQDRCEEARTLYEKVLTGLKEQRGDREQDILATMANLASCYHHLGLFDQAETLYKRALTVWEQDFGNEHPATINVCVVLGELYHAQSCLYEAADLFARVCRSRALDLGMNHPKFVEAYESLGIVYGNHAEIGGNLESARQYYKRVCGFRAKQFDKDHPKMIEISRLLESVNSRRTPQDGEAEVESTVEMDCGDQPVKDCADEPVSLQFKSLGL